MIQVFQTWYNLIKIDPHNTKNKKKQKKLTASN
jgi:hypothetical protein